MTALTTGEVLKLTSASPKTLRNLCESGVLIPVQGGEGRGHFRFFTIPQVVAIGYAGRWGAMGYSHVLIKRIVSFLCDFTEEKLLAEFAAGRKYLLPMGDLPLKLEKWPRAKHNEPFDVEQVYHYVKHMIRELAKEERAIPVSRVGRKKGLASQKKVLTN